jgi:hypothetical protein
MIRRAPSRTDEAWAGDRPLAAAPAPLDLSPFDFAAPGVEPPPGLWARIERRLAADDLSDIASAMDRCETGDDPGMAAGSDPGAWTTRNGGRVLIQDDD